MLPIFTPTRNTDELSCLPLFIPFSAGRFTGRSPNRPHHPLGYDNLVSDLASRSPLDSPDQPSEDLLNTKY